MFTEVLDTERLRRMQLSMQTSLERTRDVRPRRAPDTLRTTNRCRFPVVAAGISSPKTRTRRDEEDDDGDDDDGDDKDRGYLKI